MINQEEILITGGTGMVGTALKQIIPDANFIGSGQFNLLDYEETKELFQYFCPKYIIHLAAKVGGVLNNTKYVADFCKENILINTNVLEQAQQYNCKVVSLLSTCIYPDENYVMYPLTEDQLHNGPPHNSNYGYAYAKRLLETQSKAYNQQYGTKFYCAIPNNIFGINDNFHLENGHVVPSLIRKIWEAKLSNKNVILWGDGSPLREFTCANDIAKILLFLLETDILNASNDYSYTYNIGNTNSITIKKLAEKISNLLEYNGSIIWDDTKPKGQHKKPSDNTKFKTLNSNFEYSDFDTSLYEVCEWFKKNYPNKIRGI